MQAIDLNSIQVSSLCCGRHTCFVISHVPNCTDLLLRSSCQDSIDTFDYSSSQCENDRVSLLFHHTGPPMGCHVQPPPLLLRTLASTLKRFTNPDSFVGNIVSAKDVILSHFLACSFPEVPKCVAFGNSTPYHAFRSMADMLHTAAIYIDISIICSME